MNINNNGHKILFSKVQHSLQNKIKVLTAFGSSLYPFIDSKGEYGISENVFCIICKNISEANIIKEYLRIQNEKNIEIELLNIRELILYLIIRMKNFRFFTIF